MSLNFMDTSDHISMQTQEIQRRREISPRSIFPAKFTQIKSYEMLSTCHITNVYIVHIYISQSPNLNDLLTLNDLLLSFNVIEALCMNFLIRTLH